jgi:spore maturation protein CgeB
VVGVRGLVASGMDQAVKILIAGDWHSELHEEAVFHAFERLGHEAFKFSWHRYFKPRGWIGRSALPFYKAQNKYLTGPAVSRLNRELLDLVLQVKPDVVFVYRGTHVYPRTLQAMQRQLRGTVVVGYNNDDPFSPHHPRWMWRHFLSGIPHYDLVLAYRQHNVAEYLAAGARRVELLRSWFVPERNHPVQLTEAEKEQYACDVVFIGHYEDDGRLAYLEEAARRGWHLRIFGPGYDWDPVIRNSPLLAGHVPVRLLWGEDYNRALCGAKVALCFFSQLNRDTYTRRCFEIPASGTVLLSKYTDDVAGLFRADQEAVFFRDANEMCASIENLLVDESLRSRIAHAGTQRVWDDGHDVVSRMRNVLAWVNEIAGERR